MFGNTNFEAASSIFELGFAVNAAIPALFTAYGETRDEVARFLEEAFHAADANFTLDARKRLFMKDFVYSAWPGLRILEKITYGLSAILLAASGISFLGLIMAVLDPKRPISGLLVVLFAIMLLIVLPGLAVGFSDVVRRIQRRVIVEWSKVPGELSILRQSFDLVWDSQPFMDQADEAIRRAKDVQARIVIADMTRSIERWYERLRYPIRSIRMWWTLRSLRKRNKR